MLLNACAKNKPCLKPFESKGLTVSQIYKKSLNANKSRKINHQKRVQLHTPVSNNEEFKALPNPEVPIHVFAHVANIGGEEIIKPSYTTRFFLYKTNHYALKSELN